jgi:predicted transcriptional regulator
MGHTITVRISKELADWLDQVASKTGVAQGKIIRDQLEKSKSNDSRQSFTRLAGAVRGLKDLSRRKGFFHAPRGSGHPGV